MKILLSVTVGLFVFAMNVSGVYAHCQIPCGIYDDKARIAMMEEHITTIEKSMNEITKLSGAEEKNYNQIVRWTTNKEHHAELLQEIIEEYFLMQRVKPVDTAEKKAYALYTQQLVVLHQLLVSTMKAKQTTDLTHVVKLKELIGQFEGLYFKK